MPGATLEVLDMANVDLEQLVNDCSCVEIAMARGRELKLLSYAADGSSHTLTADIGGWERLPVASDGVIRDGAWGNVPSGETYIAPMEGTGEGSIVINGSIPGMVIEPGAELVLHFQWGRLVEIEPAEGAAARWLRETQIGRAQAMGDLNWSNLAEIGIGMNPMVKRLTGNMLFDEKAAETAHIALGSNTFMGGMINASIHCDMVSKEPTILIDDRLVVNRGRLAYHSSEWHIHHSEVDLDSSPLLAEARVARSGVQVRRSTDGQLQRALRPEPGRVSTCSVGNPETARLASVLYDHTPEEGRGLTVDKLAAQAEMDLGVARRVLHVVWEYDLIRIR
jgi:hypothetical protein